MKTLPTLNNIQDVHITAPVDNEVLTFNGTGWVNVVLTLDMENAPGTSTFVDNSPYQRAITQPGGSTVTHEVVGKKFGYTRGHSLLGMSQKRLMPVVDGTEFNATPLKFSINTITQ